MRALNAYLLFVLGPATVCCLSACGTRPAGAVCTSNEECTTCQMCVNGGCAPDPAKLALEECKEPAACTSPTECGVCESCIDGQCRTNCGEGEICQPSDGQCVKDCGGKPCTCQPSCTNKACGDSDGCSGTCLTGSCPGAATCQLGKCVQENTNTWAMSLPVSGGLMAVDASGNSYVTGRFLDPLTIGATKLTSAGRKDIYVAKISPAGQVLWATSAGGKGDDSPDAIEVDSNGNAYILGECMDTTGETAAFGPYTIEWNDDYLNCSFVAKLSPAGQFLWATAAWSRGGFGREANTIGIDKGGNVYISGALTDEALFGTHTLKLTKDTAWGYAYVARLSPAGEFLWAIAAEGDFDSTQVVRGLAVDSSSNAFVVGSFKNKAVFGTSTLVATGRDDIFIAKVSDSGQFLWAVSAGGQDTDSGFDIATDSGGNAYFLGDFQGTIELGGTAHAAKGESDLILGKVSSSGQLLWADSVGGSKYEHSESITVDAKGNLFITGSFESEIQVGTTTLKAKGKSDAFVAGVSPGTPSTYWAVSAGGVRIKEDGGASPSSCGGESIGVDLSGAVYVAGSFDGDVTFGTTELASTSYDTFIWKVSAP